MTPDQAKREAEKAIDGYRNAPHGFRGPAWKRLRAAATAKLIEDIKADRLAGAETKQTRKDLE